MNGWIKLHRRVLDNPIVFKDSAHAAVWLYLLMSVAYEPCETILNGKKITLEPGQTVTGRKKIADQLDLNESKVRRVLNDFENDQMIDQQTTSGGRLITLLNWAKYQESDQPSDQQVTNDRPTSDQQVTNERPLYKEYKESKKVKKEKNNNRAGARVYAEDPRLNEAIKNFKEHRSKIGASMTDHAVDLLLKRLEKLAPGDIDEQIRLIDYAIYRGWQGVFPIQDDWGKKEQKTDDDSGEYADIYAQYRDIWNSDSS